MKFKFTHILGLCLVALLFALQSCTPDEAITIADENQLADIDQQFADQAPSGDYLELTGEEIISTVSKVHGDVSSLSYEEVLELHAPIFVKEQAAKFQPSPAPGSKSDAESVNDVYSTYLAITIIPFQNAPPNLWTTFIDPTPPIIGTPTFNSTRTLIKDFCPGFFQMTVIAAAFKNNVGLSSRSATRSNNPTCSLGRKLRGTAQATLFTNGSATTVATIGCINQFCIVAEEPIEVRRE
ncbi:hypothetical protein QWY85_00185 [Neolewinella lacunae]|uniref:Lipoprotein n=1 Tax=Neolewinella lacunae TaxID=1517758 RepID=A0A923PJQ7_9BACT|nr:hypothetical protein [Neolewinella lacunae]MBC6995342.1 hypothetical protein [Neolewinella lacunae]MDN3633054.1 hypothetical protein [Neolewinella lacunae]